MKVQVLAAIVLNSRIFTKQGAAFRKCRVCPLRKFWKTNKFPEEYTQFSQNINMGEGILDDYTIGSIVLGRNSNGPTYLRMLERFHLDLSGYLRHVMLEKQKK